MLVPIVNCVYLCKKSPNMYRFSGLALDSTWFFTQELKFLELKAI
jgi:hypothetical protein